MKSLVFVLFFIFVANGAMLLKNYDGRDLAGWVMSEKFDGVRAIWDGKKLKSRQGKEFCAPKSFISQLPPFGIDGELWAGYGSFEKSASITARCDEDWGELEFLVFDAPEASGDLSARLAGLKDFLAKNQGSQIKIIEQIKIKNTKEAFEYLDKITAKGGEGVVVRDPSAPYKNGRQDSIMKLKKFYDAECEVESIKPRKDDNSVVGSVLCKDGSSKTAFKIGSGFGPLKICQKASGDEQNCLKTGDIITYKYQNLTKNGKPRFAIFLRKRVDLR